MLRVRDGCGSLRDPLELELVRKPEGAWQRRVRRDPAELLGLALPGLPKLTGAGTPGR